jgi:hypothetical protein
MPQVADCRLSLRLSVHNESFVEVAPVPWTGSAGPDVVPVNGRFDAVNLTLPMTAAGRSEAIAIGRERSIAVGRDRGTLCLLRDRINHVGLDRGGAGIADEFKVGGANPLASRRVQLVYCAPVTGSEHGSPPGLR